MHLHFDFILPHINPCYRFICFVCVQTNLLQQFDVRNCLVVRVIAFSLPGVKSFLRLYFKCWHKWSTVTQYKASRAVCSLYKRANLNWKAKEVIFPIFNVNASVYRAAFGSLPFSRNAPTHQSHIRAAPRIRIYWLTQHCIQFYLL